MKNLATISILLVCLIQTAISSQCGISVVEVRTHESRNIYGIDRGRISKDTT